jgi:iron complex outermembrane receptor protein
MYRRVANGLNAAPTYNGYPIALARDTTSLNFHPVNESESDEYNGTIQFDLAAGHVLTSRTAYRLQDDFQVYDLDGTPADSGSPNVPAAVGTTYIGIQFNNRSTYTQQLDYSGRFGNLDLLAGIFYYKDDFDNPQGVEDIGLGTNPTSNNLSFETTAWAAYLDGTLNISDRLFLTVGGRYSHDEKVLNRFRVNNVGTLVPTETSRCYTDAINPVFNAACNFSPKRVSANAFTPRAVLRYNLDTGTNIYASISRGFKAPTINTAPPFNTLTAETVTAYEVGFKIARRGFRGEIAGFYYDYANNQVSALSASTPSITTLIQNSGGSEIYGVDATLSYRFPNTPLNLRAGLAYLHARYTDFGNATNVVVGPTGTNTSVIGSWTGRRLVRAPDWTGSISADYTVPLFGGELLASGTLTFSSRYAPQNASYQCTRVGHNVAGGDIPFVPGTQAFCAAGTSPLSPGRFEENGFAIVNGQIGWTDPNDHFTITLFGENITNTRYKIVTTAFAYQTYQIYSEPRTFGVRLGFRY